MNKPELIGHGGGGCVYRPPLKCKEGCELKVCKDGISKLMEKEEAKNTIEAHKIIDPVDPKGTFHILTPYMCDVKYPLPTDKDRCPLGDLDTLLFYEFGGKDLSDMILDPSTNKEFLLLSLENIFRGIQVLVKNKIIHNDIKTKNILVNDQYISKLIDFDLLIKFEDDKIMSSIYFAHAPEVAYNAFVIKEVENFGDDIIQDIHQHTKWTYEQIIKNLSEIIREKYVDEYFGDNIIQDYVIRYTKWTHEQIMKNLSKKINKSKLDSYALGIVLYNTLEIFHDSTMKNRLLILASQMTHLNVEKRLHIDQAIKEYRSILYKYISHEIHINYILKSKNTIYLKQLFDDKPQLFDDTSMDLIINEMC